MIIALLISYGLDMIILQSVLGSIQAKKSYGQIDFWKIPFLRQKNN